jgi:hypothetical protein
MMYRSHESWFCPLLAALLALVSCAVPQRAESQALRARVSSYELEVLVDGAPARTFLHSGETHMLGEQGSRYILRVHNRSGRRIEAVVSVDGLDVIDGENGDLRKRGYIVPAYGETRIEGFRTSQADVATFRFSAVSGSYAAQKGKARNVGVIAVALFEEQAAPPEQIIVGRPEPVPQPYNNYRDDEDDLDGAPSAESVSINHGGRFKADKDGRAGADEARATRRSAPKKTAAAPAAPPASRPAPIRPGGGGARYVPPADNYRETGDDVADASPVFERHSEEKERLGLGTEFGEQRTSAVSYTSFVRAPGRPIAIAELRYNDTSGLMALGINVRPLPDAGEIMTRETADPFPGDRFAQPPR